VSIGGANEEVGAMSRSRERGAVAVEMAVVVPIFVLLVFGMLEFGLAFKNKLTMTSAVNQAARNATILGKEPASDYEILMAFEKGLAGATSKDVVQFVDIFRSPDGAKDRYTPTDDACGWTPCPDPDNFGGYGSPSEYPPCSRDTALKDGVDTIGIKVTYTQTWVTGVLGWSPSTWHETALGRLEPDVFGPGGAGC
jgi:TadE-like protein